MNTCYLETDRLVLRPFTEKDLPRIEQIWGDPRVNYWVPWYGIDTADAARNFLKSVMKSYDCRIHYTFAVARKEDPDRLIGQVNIKPCNDPTDPNDAHDAGWAFGMDYHNQGYCTEAARAMFDLARREGQIPYVTATHDLLNPASGRIMQKCGMVYEYSYMEEMKDKGRTEIWRMYQLNLGDPHAPVYTRYQTVFPVHFVEDLTKTVAQPDL